MAIPLLSTLPATARVAYPIIQAGARRGLSSRAIERIVRQSGLLISRGRSILPIMRATQLIEAAGANIRFIPKGLNINTSRLPIALTSIRREFSYTVRVLGQDQFGGFIDRFVTVSTDKTLVTPGELEDAARELVAERGPFNIMEVQSATLQTGIQRADRTL